MLLTRLLSFCSRLAFPRTGQVEWKANGGKYDDNGADERLGEEDAAAGMYHMSSSLYSCHREGGKRRCVEMFCQHQDGSE